MLRLNLQNEPDAYNTLVELGGVNYRLLLRWNWRTSDWRLSVQDTRDDSFLATNRRISSHSVVVAFPDGGSLQAFGGDVYDANALGVTLNVYYYTRQDVLGLLTFAATGFDPQFTLR